MRIGAEYSHFAPSELGVSTFNLQLTFNGCPLAVCPEVALLEMHITLRDGDNENLWAPALAPGSSSASDSALPEAASGCGGPDGAASCAETKLQSESSEACASVPDGSWV